MKLCREMVEVMGGLGSPGFALFKNRCFTAYSVVRKHAGVLLSLIGLSGSIIDTTHALSYVLFY